MSFSYESAWLFNAPKQTRMSCGIQLHNAVEDERCAPSQTAELQERPIIFIGHSFGGVVIEQVSGCPAKCDTSPFLTLCRP